VKSAKSTYYAVVEIGAELFGTQVDEPPAKKAERVCNAAMVVCRDLVGRLSVSKSLIPAEDAVRLRLIEHAQNVVDLVQELGRIERAKGAA
jgi:hypothetical protein